MRGGSSRSNIGCRVPDKTNFRWRRILLVTLACLFWGAPLAVSLLEWILRGDELNYGWMDYAFDGALSVMLGLTICLGLVARRGTRAFGWLAALYGFLAVTAVMVCVVVIGMGV